MNRIYDVVIVGAGPAGSVISFVLAQGGLKVAVIDKEKFPRDKACGGFVTSKTLRALKDTNIELPQSIIHQKIDMVTVHDDKDIYQYKSVNRLGVTVIRRELDNYLISKAVEAGVDFFDGQCLQGIIQKSDILEINTKDASLFCKRLVGADGVYSKTARLMGLFPLYHKVFSGVTMGGIGQWEEVCDGVCFFPTEYPGGWGWQFPLKNKVNIGVGLPIMARNSVYSNYNILKEKLNVKDIVQGGSVMPAGGLRRIQGWDKGILIGDAGGFIDPFSGEGIYYAVKTASIGAKHLKKSLSNKVYNLQDEYTKECTREFLNSFRLSMFFTIISGYKRYPCIYNKDHNIFPFYMAGLMTGDIGYRDIIKGLGKDVFIYGYRNWVKS